MLLSCATVSVFADEKDAQLSVKEAVEQYEAEKGAKVKNSVIMSDVVIGENSVIEYSIIDENVNLGKNVCVGEEKTTGKGITVLGRNISVADYVCIGGGEMIDKDVVKEGK